MRWSLSILAGALLFLSGCGGSDLVNVSGRLTYKGQPVPSTYVIFTPAEEGKRPSRGLTDDNGNFTLANSKTETGVLRGAHTVVLQYHASGQEQIHEIPPKASPELKRVIARYGDQQRSPLHYEITKSGQFIEINLE
jgi:hypothetical protein